MANSLLATAVQAGTAANAPSVADAPSGMFSMYYATDLGALWLGAGSTGSMTLFASVGSAGVTTPSTTDIITNSGTSLMNSTSAKTYSLAAPSANVEKTITTTTTSTAARTVTLVAGCNIVSTAASTIQNIVFTGLGQLIKLRGLSTSQYVVVANSAALS